MRLLALLLLSACTRTQRPTLESYAITITEHTADGGVRTTDTR